jgi:hypothetical protein
MGESSLRDCLRSIMREVDENPLMSEDELYSLLVRSGFFQKLGYGKFGVDVKPQYVIPGERKKADYICRDEYQNVIFALEAKKPRDERLEDALGQLWERYVLPLKAVYGVLTNGKQFLVYKRVGSNAEPLLDIHLEGISEADSNQLYRTLKKPEYDITLHSRVQDYFARIEKLSLKTDLAKENFFETFKLNVDSIFGKLVLDLMELFDWVYPRSKFLKGAYGFWQRSFAREPEKIPESWKPFLKGDGDVFKFMFCLESAHALLARLILAKACEDLKFPGIGISSFVVQKIHQFRGQIPLVGYPIVLLKLLKEMKDQLVYSIFEEDIFSWWSDGFSPIAEKSSGELLQEKVAVELEDFGRTIAQLLFILYKYDFSEVAGDPLGDLYQQYFDKETRKALGEFYTPVEVVNYILDAVEYKHVRNRRLLDPACGSGTFLVEALHRYLKEMEPEAEKNGWASVLRELCNSPRIVGFDIHPFACLIAQVRFMLELMPYYKKAIEEERFEVYASLQRLPIFRTDSLAIEMRPQEFEKGPKLLVTEEDIRFTVFLPMKADDEGAVAAKVIIPSFKKAQTGTQFNLFNLDDYFSVTQAMFDAIKASVKVEGKEIPLKGLEAHIKKYLTNKDFYVIAEFFKPCADKILHEIIRLQKEFEDGRLIKSIEDSILAALLKNYLHYDFVVGNPPYVRTKKISRDYIDYLMTTYKTIAHGKADLYVYFIFRCLEWIDRTGKVGLITSNKFAKAKYGLKLMQYIAKNCSFNQFVDFGDSGVFADVTNYPCIFVLTERDRKVGRSFKFVRVFKPLDDVAQTLDHIIRKMKNERYIDESIEIFELKELLIEKEGWIPLPEKENVVVTKIRKNATLTLENLCKMRMGIHHAPRDVLILDEDTIRKLDLERSYVKPLLEGKDVHKWKTSWRNLYIIFPHENINEKIVPIELDKAPNLKNYLEMNRKKLENRKFYRKKITQYGKQWYEIWNPFWFERPKIITPHISQTNNFTYDDKFYGNVNVYAIIPNNEDKDFALYLLGLLNSRVLEFYFKHISVFVSGQYYLYKHEYLGSLPIKLPKTPNEKEIASQIIQKVQSILQLSDPESLVRVFPDFYIQDYLSKGIEFDEVRYTFSLDHTKLEPVVSGQPEKGYAVYPNKGEDPVWIQTKEKAQYLVLALKDRKVRRDSIVTILIPKDNSIVAKLLNTLKMRLHELQKTPVKQLENEIDVLVCKLYDLDEHDQMVIEDFLKRF